MEKIDILGRELKDGDIVVVKGTGGYPNRVLSMDVGVFIGKTVRTRTGGARGAKDMFLVENPTEIELKIKEEILARYESQQIQANENRKQRKKDMIKTDGTVFMTKDNTVYLYCGNTNITVRENKTNIWFVKTQGHLYLPYNSLVPDYKKEKEPSKYKELQVEDFISKLLGISEYNPLFVESCVQKGYKPGVKIIKTLQLPQKLSGIQQINGKELEIIIERIL